MHTTLFRALVLSSLLALVSIPPAAACGDYRVFELLNPASDTLDADPDIAAGAIAELREHGPRGLRAMLMVHGQTALEVDALGLPTAKALAARAAIDQVAGQKDAHTSRLFWHTDFDAAKALARLEGKPILSLRLLGHLDKDLSCANSRFFRTALYANKDLSNHLRHHFVLHWKSVRPVPVITIDMGDGRTICRTITGNSIHYVLTADGHPIDAVPGLYGPQAFRRSLDGARALATTLAELPSDGREAALRAWHAERGRQIDGAWAADLALIDQPIETASADARTARDETPTAADAAPLARGKMVGEIAMVRAVIPHAPALRASTDDAAWTKIAALHAEDARLDAGSIGLMRAKTTPAASAGRLTMSKGLVEDPMLRMVRKFERSIAEDTVRNEYGFHRTIHDWFAAGQVGTDVDTLNERVYAELFLTPSSDPWLGLVPGDAYSALDAGGLGK